MTTNSISEYTGFDQPTPWSAADSVASSHVVVPRLMSIEEVSQYTGIAVATLHTWRSLGKGPKALKLGKRLRYPADLLMQWLKEESAIQWLDKELADGPKEEVQHREGHQGEAAGHRCVGSLQAA
ncbi:helix-turn-helix transcriptional regulator [Microbacterium sp. NPDC008134]|uniref:helix-turn-helix transcriptional regulator n=1 Tax=Microbacterium sp. NPDC008134 TaxID=3364183 RepID=UPI0036EE8CA1